MKESFISQRGLKFKVNKGRLDCKIILWVINIFYSVRLNGYRVMQVFVDMREVCF